jgi:glycosyltransferase involved in cell wall biosynthesis
MRTLESVFEQRHSADEVIVVDNCSTDDTEEVLGPLIRAGRIRFIRHDRNYERARSRNTGMEHATGDYVTLLDSDDLMYEDNLADAARYVVLNPSVGVFHNLYELVDTQGGVLHRYHFPSLRDPQRAICEGNFLSCIGVFVHRDIYSRYRFNTDPLLSGSEDWELWIRVLASHRPGRIGNVNSGIVHHAGRTVTAIDLERLRARLRRIWELVSQDPDLRAVYGRHLARLWAHSLIYMATVANDARDRRTARSLLAEAARHYPRAAVSPKFLRVLQLATIASAARNH